ncbi:LytTR family transcriptional regulator [Tumebacillus sp. BK434]|uniref:LytTR family DNA-binding domain-containing protein n=1 Tax=Tumebacillus sp. BK434 TaxID=2512169 RepID=UPI0010519388|nr:LytTR family DNA-binding domain-containing protein [Tumebacillus sp. BK434]TCP53427.1 LytTR family transcriptional regulator [Tumebacillus sp. BK434]
MNLQAYQQMVSSISQLLPAEASIALSDQSQYLLYRPSGAINLNIHPGDPLKHGSIAEQTLAAGNKVAHFVSPELFGVPYYGLGTPLYDEHNRVIGAMTLIVPPERSHLFPAIPRVEYIAGHADNRIVPVHESEIAYFSSNEGTTYMHTQTEVFKVKQTLQALEWLLPSHQFIRCHRAFLVNIGWIGEIQRHFHSTFLLRMKDEPESKLPVSQKYASAFRSLLGF